MRKSDTAINVDNKKINKKRMFFMVWTMLKTMGSVLWSLVKSFKWVFIIIGVFFLILAIDFLIVKFRYFRNSKSEVIGHINFDGKTSIFEQYLYS